MDLLVDTNDGMGNPDDIMKYLIVEGDSSSTFQVNSDNMIKCHIHGRDDPTNIIGNTSGIVKSPIVGETWL